MNEKVEAAAAHANADYLKEVKVGATLGVPATAQHKRLRLSELVQKTLNKRVKKRYQKHFTNWEQDFTNRAEGRDPDSQIFKSELRELQDEKVSLEKEAAKLENNKLYYGSGLIDLIPSARNRRKLEKLKIRIGFLNKAQKVVVSAMQMEETVNVLPKPLKIAGTVVDKIRAVTEGATLTDSQAEQGVTSSPVEERKQAENPFAIDGIASNTIVDQRFSLRPEEKAKPKSVESTERRALADYSTSLPKETPQVKSEKTVESPAFTDPRSYRSKITPDVQDIIDEAKRRNEARQGNGEGTMNNDLPATAENLSEAKITPLMGDEPVVMERGPFNFMHDVSRPERTENGGVLVRPRKVTDVAGIPSAIREQLATLMQSSLISDEQKKSITESLERNASLEQLQAEKKSQLRTSLVEMEAAKQASLEAEKRYQEEVNRQDALVQRLTGIVNQSNATLEKTADSYNTRVTSIAEVTAKTKEKLAARESEGAALHTSNLKYEDTIAALEGYGVSNNEPSYPEYERRVR